MNKIMSILIILCLLIVGGIIYFLWGTNPKVERDQRYDDIPVEQFIQNNLIDDIGMIRTNFSNKDGGQLFLSESNGLWLEFLAAYGSEDEFETAYLTTEDQLQLEENIFAWRILEGERATTNALIDDLRIAETLFHMFERTNHRKFLKQAIKNSEAIIKYNFSDGRLIDFYDVAQGYTYDKLTMSYVNLIALEYMVEHNILSKEKFQEIKQQMEQLPLDHDFYPMTYVWDEKRYEYEDEINLIDQLYIALHLERASVPTDHFMTLIKSIYEKEAKVYGRYDRVTKENTVSYESVAVYALIVLYALEKGDIEFATTIWDKLDYFQVGESSLNAYGGYIDETSYTTHSFDNLLALLAEGKIKSEQIIQ